MMGVVDAGDVLIDASNLRGGGGVQVASSFIDELVALRQSREVVRRFPWLSDRIVVEVSTAVADNLHSHSSGFVNVVDRVGLSVNSWRRDDRHFDVVFAVFGPDYQRRNARHRIAGFADVTSLWPAMSGVAAWNISSQARLLVRRRVSRSIFRHRDHLVVEANHVRDALTVNWKIPRESVSVVPNTLNEAFLVDCPEETLSFDDEFIGQRVCYVTRAYPHKNLDFLGDVGDAVERRGQKVSFVLTLRQDEWRRLSAATRRHSVNVGPMNTASLPGLYRQCDASIFPSLSECFSVTPLEALASGVPLLASDRAFVRDICQDAALYFDPMDPDDAAKRLIEISSDEKGTRNRVERGRKILDGWPSARGRALSYLEVIDSLYCRA